MLKPTSLGVAGGIVWGGCVFILTLTSLFWGYGTMWTALIADIYPYYQVTLWGSVLGLFWGFIDAFIGFFLIAWLYNKLS